MLETELGGVQVYTAAISCALNPDLKQEWERYLEQTEGHVKIVKALMKQLGIKDEDTPGRLVVRHIGTSLVQAIAMARDSGDPQGAEIVACECVVFAETKDHQNWQLLGKVALHAPGDAAEIFASALEEVEDQEDEHIYHSKGWCRELWLASLGIRAVLPPPEEQKDVRTAIGAARAEQAREELL